MLGGGAAAVELALAYASLGSQVTVLSRSRLLRREEPFIADFVTAGLAREGVEVRIGVTPTEVQRDEDGIVTAAPADGSTLSAQEILVATGRRPNTAGLGLEALGVGEGTPGGGLRLEVDDTLLVRGTDWLYAVGDVNARDMQTHQGKYQARAAGEVIAARLKEELVEAGEWGQHAATADHLAEP